MARSSSKTGEDVKSGVAKSVNKTDTAGAAFKTTKNITNLAATAELLQI